MPSQTVQQPTLSDDEVRARARAMRDAEGKHASFDELPGFVQGWYERQVIAALSSSGEERS